MVPIDHPVLKVNNHKANAAHVPMVIVPRATVAHVARVTAHKASAVHARMAIVPRATVAHAARVTAHKASAVHAPMVIVPRATVVHAARVTAHKASAVHAPMVIVLRATVAHVARATAHKASAVHAPMVIVPRATAAHAVRGTAHKANAVHAPMVIVPRATVVHAARATAHKASAVHAPMVIVPRAATGAHAVRVSVARVLTETVRVTVVPAPRASASSGMTTTPYNGSAPCSNKKANVVKAVITSRVLANGNTAGIISMAAHKGHIMALRLDRVPPARVNPLGELRKRKRNRMPSKSAFWTVDRTWL
jgi:hypothetical protein